MSWVVFGIWFGLFRDLTTVLLMLVDIYYRLFLGYPPSFATAQGSDGAGDSLSLLMVFFHFSDVRCDGALPSISSSFLL